MILVTRMLDTINSSFNFRINHSNIKYQCLEKKSDREVLAILRLN